MGVRAVDSTDYSVELKIVNAVMGTDLLTAGPGGGEPGFHSCSLLPADTACGVPCPDCTGVTQGVVLDFMQETFLDATDRFSPLKLFLDVRGTEGGEIVNVAIRQNPSRATIASRGRRMRRARRGAHFGQRQESQSIRIARVRRRPVSGSSTCPMTDHRPQ